MAAVSGIDHVAITVAELERSCAFYRDLFAAETVTELIRDGRVAVRKLALGGARLNLHQRGNGVEPVAARPTVGAGDVCLRWDGTLEEAVAFLGEHGVAVVFGPLPQQTADGRPAQSVYFRDPDGNLLELMAATPARAG